jgi:hypothetical protein
MVDALCTRAQVKLRVRIPVGDTVDDALIDELINDVSDWIQGFVHRRLVPDDAATYIVDTSAGSEIEIPRGIRTVTSLSIANSDQPDTGGVYAAIAAADILLRPSPMDLRPGWPPNRILIRGTTVRFTAPRINGAIIVGNFDFAATPPAIATVAADAVVAAYTARGKPASATVGAGARAVFPWATFFDVDSPAYRTLVRYRIPGKGMA